VLATRLHAVLPFSSVSFPGQRFVVDEMICVCLHVAGKIKMAANSRTMIIEINYINAKNAAIHTGNCKFSLNLSCSPRELQKMIMEKCGVEDSAAKRGFADQVTLKKRLLYCELMITSKCLERVNHAPCSSE